MIEVRNLTKIYRNHTVVDDVSFAVKPGNTMVLLGTSGSGKTTTLRMINRLIEPDAGTITINGNNILHQPPEQLRRSIGYVLQGYGLFPHFTVAENIAIVPKLLKWGKEKIQSRIDELLHKLQLDPAQYRDKLPANLSGGQMQRVGLARALAADPPILLMDEPFGALDPLTRTSVRKEFKDLDELNQKTIILVTHDVQEAFDLGDEIGLMDNGKLLQSGPSIELLFKPKNEFVKKFFKHQQLQLEWQTISLKNIWNFLDESIEQPGSVSSTRSLWQTIEALSNNKSTVIAFDEESNTTKQVTFSGLQTAFQQFRQQNCYG